MGFLSEVSLEFFGFLSMLLLASSPFISSRWQARKYWNNIKDDYNIKNSTLKDDNSYRTTSEAAADRRLSLSYMIRRYESYSQTISIMIFYALANIIRALVGIYNHLMYQSFLDVDTLLLGFLSAMIAPITYFFISNFVSFDKAALKRAAAELKLSKSISVKDVALARDETINNLSEQSIKPRFVN